MCHVNYTFHIKIHKENAIVMKPVEILILILKEKFLNNVFSYWTLWVSLFLTTHWTNVHFTDCKNILTIHSVFDLTTKYLF